MSKNSNTNPETSNNFFHAVACLGRAVDRLEELSSTCKELPDEFTPIKKEIRAAIQQLQVSHKELLNFAGFIVNGDGTGILLELLNMDLSTLKKTDKGKRSGNY